MKRVLLISVALMLLGSACGSATENCVGCDSAGKYQHCIDCAAIDTCTKFIREKSSGAILFSCTEDAVNGSGCDRAKRAEICR